MALNRIDLYDTIVKFPTDEDIKKNGNKLCYLVYATPNMASIIEYAGRTCYRSFNNIQNESYKKFITSVVSRGHESVIEHSNLVYVIFKKQNRDIKIDSDSINRNLITLMMYNGLLRVTENQGYYLISGNVRMFKDLVREYYRIKEISKKFNPIIDNIRDSFYTLPSYLFCDMISSGILEEKKFKLNPRYSEATDSFSFKSLSQYVSVINHDNFIFKVRGFSTLVDGVSTIKRLATPTNVLLKHNRITLLITAPRYITHQLVRHRMASYSQSSQRYVLEEGNNVYMPNSIKGKPFEVIADNSFKNSFNTYQTLIDSGINKEDARAVLPNAFMSTIVMTTTIDNLNHFIKLRADKAAQAFIRDEIAIPLKNYIEDYYRHSEEGEETPPPYKANAIVPPKKEEKPKRQPKVKKQVSQKQSQLNQKNKVKKQSKDKQPKNQSRPVQEHNNPKNNAQPATKKAPKIQVNIPKKKPNVNFVKPFSGQKNQNNRRGGFNPAK